MPAPRIQILPERCQRCGKCADICPEGLFVQKLPDSVPKIVRQRACIACGHCVSICPQAAIRHRDFPEDDWLRPIS